MRSIPIALQAHLEQETTTTCRLCKVICKDGTRYAFTNLDAPITYNDGTETLTYSGSNGFTPSRFEADAGFGVDNGEVEGAIGDAISEALIRSGRLDYAKMIVYEVNYLDLTQGHWIRAKGTAGETEFTDTGWKVEFRSLMQQLKQPVGEKYSLTCNAKFGDARCGKALTWVSGSVTSLGAETDRIFTDSALTQPADHFRYGVVEFLTGNNTGFQVEVEAFASGVLTLLFPSPYPIVVGDTYRVRQDCDKTFTYCKTVHNNVLNFRGQHLTPVGDGNSLMVPGAHTTRGSDASSGELA